MIFSWTDSIEGVSHKQTTTYFSLEFLRQIEDNSSHHHKKECRCSFLLFLSKNTELPVLNIAYLYNFMAKEEENKAILAHWRRRLMSTASGGWWRSWATVNLMDVWQLLAIGHNGHSPVCEIAFAKKRGLRKPKQQGRANMIYYNILGCLKTRQRFS